MAGFEFKVTTRDNWNPMLTHISASLHAASNVGRNFIAQTFRDNTFLLISIIWILLCSVLASYHSQVYEPTINGMGPSVGYMTLVSHNVINHCLWSTLVVWHIIVWSSCFLGMLNYNILELLAETFPFYMLPKASNKWQSLDITLYACNDCCGVT